MAKIKSFQFKGFTIIEALVSLTLITITVGLCFFVFNTASKDLILNRNYVNLANNLMFELENGEKELRSESIKIDNEEVEITVEDYQKKLDLKQITISIYRNKKLVYQTKALRIVEKEN